jgi:flavin reductase (DIM6/NTAB) family NADH-FMN oxidoreductase RutF
MKIQLDKPTPLIYPIPIILAGANVNGTPNFVTLGDVGLMGLNPPLVFISSHTNHHTNIGILQNNTYSINIPSTDMLDKTDYCGLVSGSEVNKSALFKIFYGVLENAPMIEECPVNIECQVIKEFCIQHRQIFVGKVIATHVNQEMMIPEDGEHRRIANLQKLDPIIYALDNCYYRIGEKIGVGYEEGQKLLEKN